MSEWKEYRLSDFIDINPKVTLKSGSKHSFVEMKDLNESQKFVSPSQLKEVKGGARFQNFDTLFARITPCLQNGKISQVKGLENSIGFGSTEFLVFRGKDSISNTDFVYYLSRYDVVRKFAEQNMIGTSGRQRVSKDAFENIELLLPSLPTQTAIAEILSSLDDKIELNNKINQELENLAQTLFKRWFVDFDFPNENGEPYKSSGGEMVDSELGQIPKGWSMKRVDELGLYISDLVANGSFASIKDNVQTTDVEDYALFIRNTDLKNRFKAQKIFVNKQSYDFLKKTELSGGEIIIPNVGDVGSVHRCPKFDLPMTLGNNCIMVKSDYMQNWLYTYFRSNVGFHSLRSVVVGSVQDKLSKTNFKSIKIVVPDEETLQTIENTLMSIYNLQESNLKESDEFEILRDTLLPKLISGELEVHQTIN